MDDGDSPLVHGTEVDETDDEIYKHIRQMSNQEHVIEPLSGGVPLFRQIKNNMEVSQLMGLGGQAPSAMKQRRPFHHQSKTMSKEIKKQTIKCKP